MMYELYPYFTNDGTVGLFSPQDDDIYHSTYGALTESWQKFVLPAHLEEYINTHDSVKILDICYGIGYNTKAALNVFVNNALEKSKKQKNNSHFSSRVTQGIAAIGTDNIASGDEVNNFEDLNENLNKNDPNFQKTAPNIVASSAAIYTDNIPRRRGDNLVGLEDLSGDLSYKSSCNSSWTSEHDNSVPNYSRDYARKKFLIDAVDTDEILIRISPFIKIKPQNNIHKINFNSPKYSNSKYSQIAKIKNSKSAKLKKEFKLKSEVQIILLEKMLKHLDFNFESSDTFNVEILNEILKEKKYSPYFSKYMLNLAKFYQNQGYNPTSDANKSTFLHNIYYRYISGSYKNAHEILKNNKIDINYHCEDARKLVKSTLHKYNFIFLDAFTPSKCPCLWTLDFFIELYSKLDADGMILTYSNSAAVRSAFLKSGFFVGKTYDKNTKKFIGTVATKNENLIHYKLTQHDLNLINSKAGLCYRDETLALDNQTIIENRAHAVEQSDLVTSSQVMKGHKHEHTV